VSTFREEREGWKTGEGKEDKISVADDSSGDYNCQVRVVVISRVREVVRCVAAAAFLYLPLG
jgi:hypothetical protein